MKVAYGICGLKPNEFWDMTWGEFNDFAAINIEERVNELKQTDFNVSRILQYIDATIPKERGAAPKTVSEYMVTEEPKKIDVQKSLDILRKYNDARRKDTSSN